MIQAVLTICREPRAPHWGLGSRRTSDGVLDLIGWRIEPAPQDGGAPAIIAGLLASALSQSAVVTFRTSRRAMSPTDDAAAESAPPFGWRLFGAARRRRFTQLSTRSKAVAASLFDDPAYPWWLGAQVALLSTPDLTPPLFAAGDWDALLGEDWTAAAARVAEHGVRGVLRAGVDGDVAGLWSQDRAFADALLRRLRATAEQVGVGWAQLSETDS